MQPRVAHMVNFFLAAKAVPSKSSNGHLVVVNSTPLDLREASLSVLAQLRYTG